VAEVRAKATAPPQSPQQGPRTHSGLGPDQGQVASPHLSLSVRSCSAQPDMKIPPGWGDVGQVTSTSTSTPPKDMDIDWPLLANTTRGLGGVGSPQARRGGLGSPQAHSSLPENVPPLPAAQSAQAEVGKNVLEQLIIEAEKGWGDTPLPNRLQHCLPWWEKWATPNVVTLIREGIKPQWHHPPHLSVQGRQGENLEQAQNFLEDYEKSGAVKRVDAQGTLHLLSWFLISKPEEGGDIKWRFISDCREINQHFQVEKFKLDHLQQIYPLLQRNHWGAKIDLKDAYFHLAINQALRPFLRHKVGNQIWEYQAGPFGLNIMPQLFQGVMKTFERKWRKRGVQVYIYLDDILIIAPTPVQLKKNLQLVVQDLLESGFKINQKKSILVPSQIVNHLGFVINFQEGKLQISPQKVKGIRKELGKFVTKTEMSKRQVAAILGQIRANLLALPFLRAFTTLLVNFLATKSGDSWDSRHIISPEIKGELLQVKTLLESWGGRPFVAKPSRTLHSDSSDTGWGGIDPASGQFVQEFWRENSHLHINVKEMAAAINTVQSLAKPGENVLLCVDNQVLFYYLQKGGGRKNPFNKMLQPFWHWLMERRITLQVKWVPSEKCLADPLSRWSQDRGDYSLDPRLFRHLQRVFSPFLRLQTDLFASPGNKKLDQFVSRWPHWQATAVDALQCPLDDLGGLYANPPWSVIQKILSRLRLFPKVKVLMVVPFWDSTAWWPQLIKMKAPGTPCLKVNPYQGMFTNCWGEAMPPPRWPLLCLICSGKFWRGNKYKIKPLTISCQDINR
jgi:hypothetical protein